MKKKLENCFLIISYFRLKKITAFCINLKTTFWDRVHLGVTSTQRVDDGEAHLEWALTAMWHKEKFEDDERGRLKIANGTRNLP